MSSVQPQSIVDLNWSNPAPSAAVNSGKIYNTNDSYHNCLIERPQNSPFTIEQEILQAYLNINPDFFLARSSCAPAPDSTCMINSAFDLLTKTIDGLYQWCNLWLDCRLWGIYLSFVQHFQPISLLWNRHYCTSQWLLLLSSNGSYYLLPWKSNIIRCLSRKRI